MVAPDECLDAADGAAREIENRLVVHDDLVPFESELELTDDSGVERAAAGKRRLKICKTSRMAAPVGEVITPILFGTAGRGRLRS